MGDGDGTVNTRSAKYCKHAWKDEGDTIVYAMNVANFTHNGILQSKEAQKFLREIVSNNIDWEGELVYKTGRIFIARDACNLGNCIFFLGRDNPEG